MMENDLDLLLGFDVNFEIMFGANLGVTTLNILTHHDERHKENLNHVRYEQPKYKAHRRIESQLHRCEKIPAQPQHSPGEDDEKKAHCADMHGYPNGEPVQRGQARHCLGIGIAQRTLAANFL